MSLQTDLPPTDLHVYVSPAYFRLADTRFYVPVSVVVPGSDVPFTLPPPRIAPRSTCSASSWTKRAGRSAASAIR